MSGKGDKRRPQNVSSKAMDENWDEIFPPGVLAILPVDGM